MLSSKKYTLLGTYHAEGIFKEYKLEISILLKHPALEFEEQIVQSMSNLFIEGIITLLQSEIVYGLPFSQPL